jgi:hypothetical protein
MEQTQKREVRLFIALPSHGNMHPQFVMSLVGLVDRLNTKPISTDVILKRLKVHNTRGSILPQVREKLLKLALEEDFTHLLFIDSDMDFPADLLHRWLVLNLPVVAANCVTKAIPTWPTARFKHPAHKNSKVSGVAVVTTVDVAKRGLITPVWRVGTGVMLMDLGVIKNIKPPRFPIIWCEETQDYIGEDWTFVEKLQEHNIQIFVDHMMSYAIGHVGDYIYTHRLMEDQQLHFELRNNRKSAIMEINLHAQEPGVIGHFGEFIKPPARLEETL